MKVTYEGKIIRKLPTDDNMILAEALENIGIDMEKTDDIDWEKLVEAANQYLQG